MDCNVSNRHSKSDVGDIGGLDVTDRSDARNASCENCKAIEKDFNAMIRGYLPCLVKIYQTWFAHEGMEAEIAASVAFVLAM